jgi:hypothetical protein
MKLNMEILSKAVEVISSCVTMEQLESAKRYNKLVVVHFKRENNWLSDKAIDALTNCLATRIDMQSMCIVADDGATAARKKLDAKTIGQYRRNFRFDMTNLVTVTGNFLDTDPIKGGE